MAVKPKEILIFEDNKGRRPFVEWLESLDIAVRAKIENRILRLHQGNYGDFKNPAKRCE